MKFYIKTKPEFIQSYQIGMNIKLSMGEKLIWVTVISIEDDKILFEAISDDDKKYLQDLLEEKLSTFSIE